MATEAPLTQTTSATPAQAVGGPARPVVRNTVQKRFVDPDDELAFPLHKRAVVQLAKDTYGKPELRLFYGDKEISFDEPELFGFGEMLTKQSRFIARSATQWAGGQPWPRVQGLLEQLIEEGVLHHAEDVAAEKMAGPMDDGARPSPLPPAQTAVARSWLECEAITQEITGRPLELGYLELVIPIFRVVHMIVDADGRQVGEANVFPKAMRLDVPTHWRACIYAGTRHLDTKPMNVTALKAMRAHWGQMMAAILRIREAYLRRFPQARDGWTVGDLERLSTAVLAVPTYQVMRRHGVENGALHPALSSLFRVTDGVRMTMHQMLFIPIGEPTTSPDAPMNSQEILDYAERNYSFHSEFGVCAGPRAMMEEFLGVLVDGIPARNAEAVVLDAEVEAALSDVERAIDYGLYGLQAYASVFSLWPIMTRAYEQLWDIAQAWQASAAGTPAVTALVERLRGILAHLKTSTYLGAEQWRVDRQKVYADMYRQCGKGLNIPQHAQSLTERIAPRRDARLLEVEQQMRSLLSRHFQCQDVADAAPHIEKFLTCLVDYFSQEQAILGVACATQRHINALLGRTPPQRPFSAAEIDIHVLLQGRDARQVPYLGGELGAILGVEIVVHQDRITITEAH